MALEAVAWTSLTFFSLNLETDYILLFISFAFTWLFYTRDRLEISDADWANNPERSAWYASKPYLKNVIVLAALFIIVFLPFRISILLPVLLGIIPCLLYTTPLRIGSYTFTLKSLPVMKVALVAFLWVLLSVLFPVFSTSSSLPSYIVIVKLSMMVGCFIMLQIHTNDLRDIQGDTQANIQSFAVLLGEKKANLFGLFLIASGFYFGWNIFETTHLLIYCSILTVRTLFYSKKWDIYWQALITSQGVLAYFILKI